MALSDTRTFLEELVLRYDPDADLSAGSRAQSDLIEPVLERVGIDPFDEDIHVFVRERVRQVFPYLAITEADELSDVLIDPIRVLFEPLVREVKLVKLRSSLRNQASLSDDEIDALMGNFFEPRRAGGYAVGVVRAYFATPQTISITQTQPATTRSGLRFFPTRPQQITADQMRLNPDGSEYYFDINYTSENRGTEYNVEPNEVVSVANLPTASRVRNIRRFRGGTAREGNSEYIARTQRSLSDRTLTVSRGISSTLFDNFPALRRLFVVGFRDPEMTRDVIEGGGLGPVPDDDAFGSFFGTATAVDDLDGDSTTPIFDGATGNFVSRLGAVVSVPQGWYATLVYTAGSLVVVDVAVLEVLSPTSLRVDHEIPLTGVSGFTWMLRQKKLVISGIPGGITLPDTAAGELIIRPDEVHIGGKTDVYVAGETEESTATINDLSDAEPIARGVNAQTDGTDVVVLNDITSFSDIAPGMSLLLEEGADAGSYLIIGVTAPDEVRLATTMTGTQANLSYRVIDEIDVELTDPKTIKVEGDDLLTSAGSAFVNTSGGTNFLDVNVQSGDVLEVIADLGGGEFTITDVGALYLKVNPVLPRTITGAAYKVFTRSEAVRGPVVRVRSIELVDGTGAPTGTTIPYRDPVLVLSNAFQNEGSGYPFDNNVRAGLVSTGVSSVTGFVGIGGQSLNLDIYDPDDVWGGVSASISITFSAGPDLTAAQVVTEINASVSFAAQGVRATEITYKSLRYVGFVATQHVRVTGGTALSMLGMSVGDSNSDIVSMDAADTLQDSKVRRTDLVEFLSGNNVGTVGRVIQDPDSTTGIAVLGTGPLGPEGSTRLYYNLSLRPDVGVRARAGRPSVGSARVFFLAPTSAEFDFRTTQFSAEFGGLVRGYIPDPENTRTVLPAYPNSDTLVATGTTGIQTLSDTSQNYLLQRVQPGDVVEILYRPITGTAPLSAVVATLGLVLTIKLGTDPFVVISFPFATMPRQDVADYINAQLGEDIASLSGTNALVLKSSLRIEIDSVASAAALTAFSISTYTSDHPERGEYIVLDVAETVLTISPDTPLLGAVSESHYRIKRYVQRISSTEMNLNLDASGLYYADVQMVSLAPGDTFNIPSGVEMLVAGHRSDGYRLSTDNEATSYSRAEVLRAQISPSMLLVGSSDSPEEYVQLPQQSVLVTYDRSQIADDAQSFCDSDFQRVVCEEILVRHLLPHYVSLTWSYAGGSSEPEMLRGITELLDELEPDDEFEVGDLIDVLRRKGATSVYTPDSSATSGRAAPMMVVVHHGIDRKIRGLIVRDFVDTNRTQRYIPDNVTVRRISTGGIR